MATYKPSIAITMGDPSESDQKLFKSLNDQNIYENCRPFVVGDLKILKEL
jgi:4-hydroxythreonine-4-phosphate dehydrogenase